MCGTSVVSALNSDIEEFFEMGDISLEDFAFDLDIDEGALTTDDSSAATPRKNSFLNQFLSSIRLFLSLFGVLFFSGQCDLEPSDLHQRESETQEKEVSQEMLDPQDQKEKQMVRPASDRRARLSAVFPTLAGLPLQLWRHGKRVPVDSKTLPQEGYGEHIRQ